ncbi:MAG: HD domain-containing protein [Candidatus Portnoybacteria bacterium]|nr:HD domain-containing protein [Candidatus Portnoybacteria bacterium]
MIIPKEVNLILEKLEKTRPSGSRQGFEVYIVGGCVRDLLLGQKPKDWDITTNAKPEQIRKLFPKNFYENKFGTVSVITNAKDETLKVVEITPFRLEGKYSDKRHPDEITFAKTLEEDLGRRDFTINALALNKDKKIVDYFDGQKDLKNKIIRTVGKADERFSEDALRMLRAVRFACTLGFSVEEKTFKAIQKNADWIQMISNERIRDELIKIFETEKAAHGIDLLRQANLLKYILLELEKGVGVSQNKHHIYDIYEHSMRSLDEASKKKFNLEVKVAALFHDIGKPVAKAGEGPDSTFYNHDYIGAKFTFKILQRLKFPNKFIDKVVLLVKNHMFVSDPERLTDAGARRLIKRVGTENISDLINLRVADRLGMGRPKEKPYRLRTIEYMIEKVSKDPISVKMLKINGNDIMKLLSIQPSPKVGAILDVLLAEVIEDPKKNNKKYLENRVKELNEQNLEVLRKLARGKIEEKKEEEDLKIREKHWIK